MYWEDNENSFFFHTQCLILSEFNEKFDKNEMKEEKNEEK